MAFSQAIALLESRIETKASSYQSCELDRCFADVAPPMLRLS
jgi:hypothetical protein